MEEKQMEEKQKIIKTDEYKAKCALWKKRKKLTTRLDETNDTTIQDALREKLGFVEKLLKQIDESNILPTEEERKCLYIPAEASSGVAENNTNELEYVPSPVSNALDENIEIPTNYYPHKYVEKFCNKHQDWPKQIERNEYNNRRMKESYIAQHTQSMEEIYNEFTRELDNFTTGKKNATSTTQSKPPVSQVNNNTTKIVVKKKKNKLNSKKRRAKQLVSAVPSITIIMKKNVPSNDNFLPHITEEDASQPDTASNSGTKKDMFFEGKVKNRMGVHLTKHLSYREKRIFCIAFQRGFRAGLNAQIRDKSDIYNSNGPEEDDQPEEEDWNDLKKIEEYEKSKEKNIVPLPTRIARCEKSKENNRRVPLPPRITRADFGLDKKKSGQSPSRYRHERSTRTSQSSSGTKREHSSSRREDSRYRDRFKRPRESYNNEYKNSRGRSELFGNNKSRTKEKPSEYSAKRSTESMNNVAYDRHMHSSNTGDILNEGEPALNREFQGISHTGSFSDIQQPPVWKTNNAPRFATQSQPNNFQNWIPLAGMTRSQQPPQHLVWNTGTDYGTRPAEWNLHNNQPFTDIARNMQQPQLGWRN